MNPELIIGENRVLTIDLCEESGAPLLVTGWNVELRIGRSTVKLVKPLSIDPAIQGRVSCIFVPNELNSVGENTALYHIWRNDVGSVWLISEGSIQIRRVW